SRTRFCRLRFEHLLALHSDATATAGTAWRLQQGAFPEPLSSRRRLVPNSRRLAPAYRTLCPSRLGFACSCHCKHRPRSHLDGPQRAANGGRRFDFIGLSHLAIRRRFQRNSEPLIQAMATETDKQTVHVVVRGGARNFQQEVMAGKHRLVAEEPVSVGGGDAGPDPYDYLLTALGVCTSMTIGFYARRNRMPLGNITVSLSHSRIYAADCEECETKEGMLDRIDVEVELTGSLTAEQHAKLMQVAAKCPVHRTLTSEINIRLRAAEKSGWRDYHKPGASLPCQRRSFFSLPQRPRFHSRKKKALKARLIF